MAFIIGLVAAPLIANEMANAVEDVCSFDYTQYTKDKMQNGIIHIQLSGLELKHKHAWEAYCNETEKYKLYLTEKNVDFDKLKAIKKKRDYYRKKMERLGEEMNKKKEMYK